MEIWHVWLIAALVFIIVEIFTAGFAVACFSVGCVPAAIVAACDGAVVWQFVIFALGTFLAFALVRPLVLKLCDKSCDPKTAGSNMDIIIGRTAVVTKKIEKNGFGRVKIDGDDWKARLEDNGSAEIGEKVTVVSYESIILTVKK